MTTHLALLRGINVSGHNLIKMEALQKALESIGFVNVQTYIQTGNMTIRYLYQVVSKAAINNLSDSPSPKYLLLNL